MSLYELQYMYSMPLEHQKFNLIEGMWPLHPGFDSTKWCLLCIIDWEVVGHIIMA